MTNFISTPEDDAFILTPGRDIIEIKPDGGHDTIADFESGADLLVFNEFGFISPESITPFFTSDQEAATLTLDLSAAQGQEPGLQTVLFTDTFGVSDDDMAFNIGVTGSDDGDGKFVERDFIVPSLFPSLPLEDYGASTTDPYYPPLH